MKKTITIISSAFLIAGTFLPEISFAQTPTDQTITPVSTSFLCNGEAIINVAGTETGVNYYLRNDADNSIVAGPVAGTGSAIDFNTGILTTSTTFNVNAMRLTSALDFDGSNDYVQSPSVSMSGIFTYETWIKTNETTQWSGIITTNSGSGTGMWMQFVLSDNGTLRWESNSPNLYIANMSTIINDNVWHHVAVVSDGSNLTFYVDGNLEYTTVFAAGSCNRVLQFMAERQPAEFTNGLMDEARIWDVARTQSEIQASMNTCLTGSESGLVIYYKFEDGTGSSTVTDIAGGDQNGTLTNMDASTDWTAEGKDNCGASLVMTTKPTVTVNQIIDQVITNTKILCSSANINLASSENTVFYYLRKDSNDSIVAGPIAGNGSAITFTTATVGTYNVFAEAIVNSAIDLPASNDYVIFNAPFYSYGNEITVQAMVNFNNGEFPWAGQSTGNADNSTGNVWLWHSGTFYVNDDGNWRSINFPAVSSGWVNVTTVANVTGLYIYYDGVLVASNLMGITSGIRNNSSSIIALGTDPRYLGDVGRNSNTYFDNLKIWNFAKTETEIAENMNACLVGNETGLVQYTLFNEAAGVNISSITGSNATIVDPTANWIQGVGTCGVVKCSLEMTTISTVTTLASPDQIPTASQYSFCDNGSSTISIPTSEVGVNYYLQLNSDNSIIDGPLAGTGSALSFTTGTISATTVYEVYAEKAVDAACNFEMTTLVTITQKLSSVSSITVVACNSYTAPDGAIYTGSGTETAVIPNAVGCDSTITIDLTINTVDVSVTQNGNTLTATAPGATYEWLDCNSNTTIPGEVSQSYVTIADGDYAVIVTENNCTDTSACVNILGTGISSKSKTGLQISVYPNPNTGMFVIKTNVETTFTIVNSLGQNLQTVKLTAIDNYTKTISDLANGIYFIKNDKGMVQQKVVVVR